MVCTFHNLVAMFLLAANPSKATPPSIEVHAVNNGLEIHVDKMKIVGQRFHLDQAKQELSVEGQPAVVYRNHAGEPHKHLRGAKVIVSLAHGSIKIEDQRQPENAQPKKKDSGEN